ncbi:glycosyltransferase family 4 protein [Zafaria sp. J156]|uniref:glycosyltransferase family 4 protein n=1 Tax=Zafaria sp. J156 TaxID=3116490 RepID=UPI002E766636|nr:glycosyltransferase family 4 protein [Zafaria sp. J156]MEE1620722.1 glycosyltransferase family 4 protein [Zafaria sp. J156]
MGRTATSASGGRAPIGRLLKNAAITWGVVRDHVNDDPIVLLLQTARRFNTRPVLAAAGLGARLLTRDDSVAGAVFRAVLGDTESVRRDLSRVASRGTGRRRTVHLADVATAIGDSALAGRLLAALPPLDSAAAGARARLAWHDGDMSAAVRVLEGLPGGHHRLRRTMQGELATFRGQAPRLAARPGYRAVPGRALHLVTNSLPHTGSGYAQRTQSVLASLRHDGWDVLAVTRLGYPVEVGKPLARNEDVVDGIRYRRLLPTRIAGDLVGRQAQQARLLASIVEEFRPAVLHTTTHFVNAAVVRSVADAYGIPWVYEVRGQLADTWASTRPDEARDSERYRLFRDREAEAAGAADAVITLGAAMRRELVDQGVDPSRITICPNAVGEAFLAAPGPATEARKALGLDPSLSYIGTVTSVVPYEGLDDLVRAFALLTDEHPDLRLLVVGDGVSLPGLRLLAQELGVAGRCLFTGRVAREQASVYHQALDVFVVPRKDQEVTRRVTPLKPVEASASCRPVVASDLDALAELVHHAKTGFLAPAESPERLADAIDRLLRDPELCEKLGAAGRAWVLEERTWAANAQKYSAVYRGLGAGVAGDTGSDPGPRGARG